MFTPFQPSRPARGESSGSAARLCIAVIAGSLACRCEVGALETETSPRPPSTVAIGLRAVYTSADESRDPVVRIDPGPSFTWGRSSPHPALGRGPFSVRWSGRLVLDEDAASLAFSAFVSGEVSLKLGGREVIRSATEEGRLVSGTAAPLEAGEHDFELAYRSPRDDSPSRLQLFWEGDTFAREPLPPWVLRPPPGEDSSGIDATPELDEGFLLARSLGCLACHRDAIAGAGPAASAPRLLAEGGWISKKPSREWLLGWLDEPRALKADARMPRLFGDDRRGFVERWLVTRFLLSHGGGEGDPSPPGSSFEGKRQFARSGCVACHLLADAERAGEATSRSSLRHLGAREDVGTIARLILDPGARYPRGGMPRFPLGESVARHLATFIHASGEAVDLPSPPPPDLEELRALARELGVELAGGDPEGRGVIEAGRRLAERKRCGACHAGLPRGEAAGFAEAGGSCLDADHRPAYSLSDDQKRKLLRFLRELRSGRWSDSPFHFRQVALVEQGCFRCHTRDPRSRSPLERVVREVPYEQFYARIPYLRVPVLAGATSRFRRDFLLGALEKGSSGARPSWYSYRMPAYGELAPDLLRGLLEGEGEAAGVADPGEAPAPAAGSELAAIGRELAGHGRYSCVSCHIWKGRSEFHIEPGSVGPDLTQISRRIRRDFFDRWLQSPQRVVPGTPMPAFFPHGVDRAPFGEVLEGDPARHREALWQYLALGAAAEAPKLRPPQPLPPLPVGARPRVGQIPLRGARGGVEALTVEFPGGDLLVYDVARLRLARWHAGARILRDDPRWRTWLIGGADDGFVASFENPLDSAALPLALGEAEPLVPEIGGELERRRGFLGYEVLSDGLRIRTRFGIGDRRVLDLTEELRLEPGERSGSRTLQRSWTLRKLKPGEIAYLLDGPAPPGAARWAEVERSNATRTRRDAPGGIRTGLRIDARADSDGTLEVVRVYTRPALPSGPDDDSDISAGAEAGSGDWPAFRPRSIPSSGPSGYHVVEYGQVAERRIMPSSLCTDPRRGTVYLGSMKQGEVFRLDEDPSTSESRLVAIAGPLQEPYGLSHDGTDLHVLHRRNITRVRDAAGTGLPARFERLATWPQGLISSYDWGYGLVPQRDGSFLFGLAPWKNRHQKGAGGVLRLRPDGTLDEVAFGFRNHVGWCADAKGELYVTDNQGEWVAANRLCHVVEGRFYGFPNSEQLEHREKPRGYTTIWVPYAWARSINGVVCDTTGGAFGPFDGQLFLAELYTGGAIIRAWIEEVDGVRQGACFKFWGEGLLGPLTLAFDPRGRLYVGSITEPAWMGQPDRGGLYRIHYDGPAPFEMQSIRVRADGFEIAFTGAVDPVAAGDPASYRLHHYRYEYGPAYGSPELDRTTVEVHAARVGDDGRTVRLRTDPLLEGRIYYIRVPGVRDRSGRLVEHPEAAYTLNRLPALNR